MHPSIPSPPSIAGAVLRRTLKGRDVALSSRQGLTPAEANLLLLVNGYTPVDALPGLQKTHTEEAVSALLLQGLIEPVEPTL